MRSDLGATRDKGPAPFLVDAGDGRCRSSQGLRRLKHIGTRSRTEGSAGRPLEINRDHRIKRSSGYTVIQVGPPVHFPRNVCELLFGISPGVTINPNRQKVTADQAAAIHDWLRSCDLSWQECSTVDEADQLERRLRREYMPPLNRN